MSRIKKYWFLAVPFIMLFLALSGNSLECFDNEEEIQIPIVMYHNLTNKQRLVGRYALSVKQFENDIKYLKDNGYTSVNMDMLIDFAYNAEPLPQKPVMITFDDGYESFYTYAYPILQKYDFCAVMSVVGSFCDFFTKEQDHNVDYSYLTWEEVNEMSKTKYVEIQNHTYDLHEITKERKGCYIKKGESEEAYRKELIRDLSKAQERIAMYTGKVPTTFTYPYGCICDESIPIVKEMGFKAILNCCERVNTVKEGTDWLYGLGRFNREPNYSSSEFFQKRMKLK